MSFALLLPEELALELAGRVRQLRLARGLKRTSLAERAGISASTLKHFESTGTISLENLLKVALALGCLEHFESLFAAPAASSLDELTARSAPTPRKRGRR